MQKAKQFAALFAAVLAFVAVGSEASARKVGSEFRVNTTTAGGQAFSSVAALNDGGFLAVWTSWDDESGSGDVFAQRYDSIGAPMGSEFEVNTVTAGSQISSGVAGLSGGGFVVVWTVIDQVGPDAPGIYAQVYDSSGARVGSEIGVSEGNAFEVDVAGLRDGGFAIAFSSKEGVYVRIYGATGSLLSRLLHVDRPITAINKELGNIAALPHGGFVVVWQSDEGSAYQIYGQRFTAIGRRLGSEFNINSTGQGARPKVIGLRGDGFVVVWIAQMSNNFWAVNGQRYDANGTTIGTPFQVNTNSLQGADVARVGALRSGGFVVAWDSSPVDDIHAQRYDAAGARYGTEFLVNTYTRYDQDLPSLAGLANGGFVVIWDSELQDGSGWGVYGQRYNK